jgi:hypothetical protein
MKPQPDRDARVEELLRQALPDDLPADIAAGMRERIVRFRAAQAEDRAPGAGRAWLRRRTVWAALSLMILVAGIILQGARASSPLADRISALKTAALNPGQIRR